eukprot:Mycagemm_TRINITY_DN10311_c3_g5::TRINITY_DN10311_c3_g5_i1::g.1219::m.1219 type:complete len:155 gc:universal TRINITY_DN10311_c3_g5_i1:1091-627(-)
MSRARHMGRLQAEVVQISHDTRSVPVLASAGRAARAASVRWNSTYTEELISSSGSSSALASTERHVAHQAVVCSFRSSNCLSASLPSERSTSASYEWDMVLQSSSGSARTPRRRSCARCTSIHRCAKERQLLMRSAVVASAGRVEATLSSMGRP